jgi:Flp pilus assembly pilin Flp
MNLWLIRVYARILAPSEDESGQATAEYALVLLGAALVAVLLITRATAGGGAGKIGQLLDRVVDSILSKVR